MTVEIDGDFVVFLIGARVNKLRALRSLVDLGGRRGMKHMLDYLVAHPDKGLLAYEMGLPTIVQYWRSFEHLEAFAKDKDDPHLEVWRQYWRRVGQRPHRHLARDLLGERWTVRGCVREYAPARAGEGREFGARGGVFPRPFSARSTQRLTVIASS
jgi:hypothetical protein